MSEQDAPKAGVIQMTSTDDVDANLRTMAELVLGAAGEGASLVLVPECFAFLGPEDGKLAIAESLEESGPILTRCADVATKANVQLVLGGFWERGPAGKVRNACVHMNADGSIAAVYRKIHLFDVDLPNGVKIEESATVAPGDETVVTDSAVGRLGLSVCYDLRFPELYRQLVDDGATVLAIPAAFTKTTGQDHWHILLRARAIEQQSYVLAAAQVGHHFGNRYSYGHALIADPWGRVLAECGDDGDEFAVAAIDASVVEQVRRSLPSLAHRKLKSS